MSEKRMTHLDDTGAARMVDVSGKVVTAREAMAEGELHAAKDTLDALVAGAVAKGDAMAVARVAGIQAAKRTSELIPLCHPIATTSASIDMTRDGDERLIVRATVRTNAQTGVEMEALTAASVALLTLYDMLKSMQKDIRLHNIRLRRKTGGKSGDIEFP